MVVQRAKKTINVTITKLLAIGLQMTNARVQQNETICYYIALMMQFIQL